MSEYTKEEILEELKQLDLIFREQDFSIFKMDYNTEYLKSKLWAKIKRRILRRDNSECKLCGEKTAIVHHRSYDKDVLEGKNDSQLISLCEGCHGYVHFTINGEKRSAIESDLIIKSKNIDSSVIIDKIHLGKIILPNNWKWMNGVQRKNYLTQYHQRCREQREIKKQKYLKNPQSTIREVTIQELQFIKLEIFLKENNRFRLKNYSIFLDEIKKAHQITICEKKISAIKVNRVWYINQIEAQSALKEMFEPYIENDDQSKFKLERITDGCFIIQDKFKIFFSYYSKYYHYDHGKIFCITCGFQATVEKNDFTIICNKCSIYQSLDKSLRYLI